MSIDVEIHKRFRNFALDVAFQAGDEVLGILGASGSGKSMTLRCIAGVEKPDSGKIIIDGQVCYDSEAGICLPPQKRHTGYLFQQYALFPKMTVAENITVGMKNKANVATYLKQFHLEGLEERYPAQLSGGQKQRVGLARIFAHQSEILLLDEPFSALDTYLKWQMQCEMKQILEAFSGTVLFVSHSRDEIFRFCDKVAVLENGKVDHQGSIRDVFAKPQTVAATRLTGCKNISRIRRIDPWTVEALDWGIQLKTAEPVEEDITHIGIRAHFFYPAAKTDINSIPVACMRIVESQFKVSVLFQKKDENAAGSLCWDYERVGFQKKVTTIPDWLAVRPEDILLLKGE